MMKVLVVDDSRVMRRTIARVAEEMGLEVVEAANGAEALTKLQDNAHEIALTILDWSMPVMDGFQVLEKIRSTRTFNHIPVLMATSDGVDTDVKRAIAAGAKDYLVNPFSKEQIKARIERHIPKSHVTCADMRAKAPAGAAGAAEHAQQ